MDIARFKEVVGSFLDSAESAQWSKGTLVAQLGTELIEADLRIRNGQVHVFEGAKEQVAEEWITNRLAMLDVLAERILSTTAVTNAFVTPSGELVDEISRAAADEPESVDDAVDTAHRFLDRRPGGTCSVLYLTSDAGEGKTTVIDRLARSQAQRFKARQSDWLLVPVGLGGRPFLRFDDVIMAAFMNQLRFQRLYYDAFLQLVRMGTLVPALDGFEEIFVETSDGEAVSGLGNLIGQLAGEGTLLIAARKAFFEFRRLETQAKLLDSLPNVDVAFGRVSLRRWAKRQFLDYCILKGFARGEQLYDAIAARVSADHPLLTRAVLVKQLVDLAIADGTAFVDSLTADSASEFRWLVDRVLVREATEKWLNKHSTPPVPLLSVPDHRDLLCLVAEEMWLSKTALLPSRMLDSLADIYSDHRSLSPQVARQVRERLRDHALLSVNGAGRSDVAFDHEHFRQYFLGLQLAKHLSTNSASDVRKFSRSDYLPHFTLDTAVSSLATPKVAELSKWIGEVAAVDGSAGYSRENAGALVIRLLERATEDVVVNDVLFPPQALAGRIIRGVTFSRCYFHETDLEGSRIESCTFVNCEFERLEYGPSTKIIGTKFAGSTEVRTVARVIGKDCVEAYDPLRIEAMLAQLGFSRDDGTVPTASLDPAVDERWKMTEKAIQTFQRTTQVNEGTFKLRLSRHTHTFLSEVLPALVRRDVLQVVGGRDIGTKYRLGVPMARIARALADSQGSFDRFLEEIDKDR